MSHLPPEEIHGTTLLRGVLPGEPVPYYLQSGEGESFEVAGQLWTVIARTSDTGGDFDAAFVTGRRGSHSPFHALPAAHRTFFVLSGQIQVWIDTDGGVRSRVLTRGDSVTVPPATLFGYRMLAEGSRMLMYSAPGGALDAILARGAATSKHYYSAQPPAAEQLILPDSATVADLPDVAAGEEWDDVRPAGVEPYFLRNLEGEHRAWPDAINTHVVRPANTGGRYFAVDTFSAPAPYIIQHFHAHHTENFFCLAGRVWLWVNGEEVLLTEGDFLHAPAGTIHSSAIAGHGTRMLGILASGVFEPFFDVTSQPTEDKVYTEGLIDPSIIFGGIKSTPDLDLHVVGPPPERVFAPGI